MSIHSHIFTLFLLLLALLLSGSVPITGHEFSIKEATVHDFQMAFKQNKLTSRQLEKVKECRQDLLQQAQATKGIKNKTLLKVARWLRNGFEKLMKKHKLDALVTPGVDSIHVLGIAGFPGIVVPAGYDSEGVPFSICCRGLKGSEPKLIEIAYSFEQATKIRKPPSFKP